MTLQVITSTGVLDANVIPHHQTVELRNNSLDTIVVSLSVPLAAPFETGRTWTGTVAGSPVSGSGPLPATITLPPQAKAIYNLQSTYGPPLDLDGNPTDIATQTLGVTAQVTSRNGSPVTERPIVRVGETAVLRAPGAPATLMPKFCERPSSGSLDTVRVVDQFFRPRNDIDSAFLMDWIERGCNGVVDLIRWCEEGGNGGGGGGGPDLYVASGTVTGGNLVLTLSNGSTVTIPLPADADDYTVLANVVSNSLGGGLATLTRLNGGTVSFNLPNDVVTTLTYNAGTNTLTYTNEAGAATNIALPSGGGSEDYAISGSVAPNGQGGGVATITRLLGGTFNFNLPNDVVTTLTYNPTTQTLTYTNEVGAVTTVAIPPDVLTTLAYNSSTNTLTYVDEQGASTALALFPPPPSSAPTARSAVAFSCAPGGSGGEVWAAPVHRDLRVDHTTAGAYTALGDETIVLGADITLDFAGRTDPCGGTRCWVTATGASRTLTLAGSLQFLDNTNSIVIPNTLGAFGKNNVVLQLHLHGNRVLIQ